jgi:hypothetical protein
MPDRPIPDRPAAMEPSGSYNRSSRVQSEGVAPALPLLEQAARTVAIPAAPASVCIADYGASQGRNSLAPMRLAVDTLRPRLAQGRAILVAHTDQASNDFSALFATLESNPKSYLKLDPATYAMAVGRSFYQPILPPGSVTLGWSSWAVQWLSHAPREIPDQIQIAYSRDGEAREAFARQAALDWEAFLRSRSVELHQGGALVIVTMAMTDEGDFGYRDIVAAMYGALIDLVASGFLHAEEVRRMAIPTVARRRADLLAPFAPDDRFAGFTVDHLDIFLAPDWIWSAYEQERDAALFGARWAAFNRASVYPTLAQALSGEGGEARKIAFFERLEQLTAACLAASPRPAVIPLALMVLRKGVD